MGKIQNHYGSTYPCRLRGCYSVCHYKLFLLSTGY